MYLCLRKIQPVSLARSGEWDMLERQGWLCAVTWRRGRLSTLTVRPRFCEAQVVVEPGYEAGWYWDEFLRHERVDGEEGLDVGGVEGLQCSIGWDPGDVFV